MSLGEDGKRTVLSDTPIDKCNLSNKAMNCLLKMGIKTLGDLSNVTINKLFETRNFGIKAFKEIAEIMKKYGISFNNGKIDISFHI
ncbi:MAG: hypothetical protein II033_01080, partial [Clostridia bacterium]|nr:hypothetical protein [Clostridia bacterium]